MQDFFIDIFQYHHHYNQKLADLLLANPSPGLEKAISLFSHSINAHQIWNARILEKETLGVHQLHTLNQCKVLDNANFLDTKEIFLTTPLDTKITYQNSKGLAFENSVKDILFHIANHFTHHKGQIIYKLRHQGVEPIVTDYIFYKR